MEPYLFHGIRWYNFDILMKIIESGFILPRCQLGKDVVNDKNNIFNGEKYISLSQKSLNEEGMLGYYKSAYDDYIVGKPCLVLKNKTIKLIFPELLSMFDKDYMSPEEWNKMIFNDDDTRHSYYMDELQTDNPISLKENLIAVGLPIRNMKKNIGEEETYKIFEKVSKLVKEKGYDVPIIDSSSYSFADNEERINESVIKH